MARNTGKPSEEAWENTWARLGKKAWVHRLVDAAEIKGRTGKVGAAVRPMPSDYILVHDGRTEFAEVKSTQDETAFRFNLLRTKQSAAAAMILAAGGEYWIYAHRLSDGRWFRFPYSLVTKTKAAGKASLPWPALKEYEWNPLSMT